MKALRITIHQQTATFRKPTSRTIQESYPLPPYSTVLGFIHTICGYTSYHDMKLSIQGQYKSKTLDFARQRYVAKNYDKSRHQYNLSGTGLSTGIATIELLVDLTTVIHIIPTNEDFEYIHQHLLNPLCYPALGRHEDIATIKDVKIVDVESISYDDDKHIDYAAYIPKLLIDNVIDTATNHIEYGGITFSFGKEYQIDEKLNKRIFKELTDVIYTTDYHIFADEPINIDTDGLPVFLV